APEAMWELTDRTPTPRLADALAAVGDGRADRGGGCGPSVPTWPRGRRGRGPSPAPGSPGR
ncbi:hypothetical protein L0F81_43260, partial [Streptomyces tricolor]|nr:hypothetical protein [Streptomyces tricolor]